MDSTAAAARTSTPAAPGYRFRLYVAGTLPNSLQAQQNLRRICDDCLAGRYTLEIIDFLESPARALEDGILVTPTLLKVEPAPPCTIVGTLADRATVLRALDVEGA